MLTMEGWLLDERTNLVNLFGQPVAEPFLLPEVPSVELFDPVRIFVTPWLWGTSPEDQGGECWTTDRSDLDRGLFSCVCCQAMAWRRPKIVTFSPEGEPCRIGALLGFGWHRVRSQDEAHFAHLFINLHDHVLPVVDTAWLAEGLGISAESPERVQVDVRIMEQPRVGGLAPDWKLFAVSIDGRLRYGLEYRADHRGYPVEDRAECESLFLPGDPPWPETVFLEIV